MRVSFTESEMLFSFEDDKGLFRIEKSSLYHNIGSGVCTTEYVALIGNNVLQFVEAKKSCPNLHTRGDSTDKAKKYEEYYRDISRKFIDSLMMMTAAMLDRYGREEMGIELQRLNNWKGMRLRFLLIIKTAEEEWLGGVKAELEQRLMEYRKIWKVEILVLNEAMAMQKGFVV